MAKVTSKPLNAAPLPTSTGATSTGTARRPAKTADEIRRIVKYAMTPNPAHKTDGLHILSDREQSAFDRGPRQTAKAVGWSGKLGDGSGTAYATDRTIYIFQDQTKVWGDVTYWSIPNDLSLVQEQPRGPRRSRPGSSPDKSADQSTSAAGGGAPQTKAPVLNSPTKIPSGQGSRLENVAQDMAYGSTGNALMRLGKDVAKDVAEQIEAKGLAPYKMHTPEAEYNVFVVDSSVYMSENARPGPQATIYYGGKIPDPIAQCIAEAPGAGVRDEYPQVCANELVDYELSHDDSDQWPGAATGPS